MPHRNYRCYLELVYLAKVNMYYSQAVYNFSFYRYTSSPLLKHSFQRISSLIALKLRHNLNIIVYLYVYQDECVYVIFFYSIFNAFHSPCVEKKEAVEETSHNYPEDGVSVSILDTIMNQITWRCWLFGENQDNVERISKINSCEYLLMRMQKAIDRFHHFTQVYNIACFNDHKSSSLAGKPTAKKSTK